MNKRGKIKISFTTYTKWWRDRGSDKKEKEKREVNKKYFTNKEKKGKHWKINKENKVVICSLNLFFNIFDINLANSG